MTTLESFDWVTDITEHYCDSCGLEKVAGVMLVSHYGQQPKTALLCAECGRRDKYDMERQMLDQQRAEEQRQFEAGELDQPAPVCFHRNAEPVEGYGWVCTDCGDHLTGD